MTDKKEATEEKKQEAPSEETKESLKDLEGGSTDAKQAAATNEGAKDKEEHPKADEGKMWIKVYSPYQVYYDNQAQSISAVNETGPFDILAHHHKFLTLLEPCEMVIIDDSDEQKIKIARGVMYVKEDRVTVFLDI